MQAVLAKLILTFIGMEFYIFMGNLNVQIYGLRTVCRNI